ncbi:ATP-dependent Clp protease ATP-binding subunit ClpA [Clostridium bowmanii]|uniref:ATP-dependent Clp protease ATP-binding subunit ClpA n=1 Tax=Clostridium bowmanii TaxID=132925 RepID=UPI001C0B5D04|nr:ATP-dependent Clp protease ATP-binding subunit ClpA [Clostridium bowmanii]MBU3188021.1 ATP-dependent Clp protease ATP-binding subunit ClpA [Clostridium bowmanii]MCA1072200.1 ATP-dependent Clp protease ATP-binding subunit ClpA [Clostridium bowmanii]
MQLDNIVNEIITAAYNEAQMSNHEYFTPEHILYASLFFEEGIDIVENSGGNVKTLKKQIVKFLKENIDVVEDAEPIQTIGIQTILSTAEDHVMLSGKELVRIGDLIVAMYDDEESFASYFLRKQQVKRRDLLNYIAHGISVVDTFDFAGTTNHEEEESVEFEENEEDIDQAFEEDMNNPKGEENFLGNFTVELTQKARRGEMDPLIGRKDILQRTLQVLCRRLKNNPVHVGEPGVGKTAITEGLAQLIMDNKVPKLLQGSKIFYLDMGSLIAGTKYRGDFEERIKRVLREISKEEKPIVYIDEIHTIVGAGAVSGGSMDASNILKPFLADGKVRFIGSTTYDEYKKHFEKDSALARRFQKIEVPEPSTVDTFDILMGLKDRYEDYHNVIYKEEALKTAVELSSKYIKDRYLPDKAIDIMDEAGAYARLNAEDNEEPIVITVGAVEKVVASIAKIPEESVSNNEVLTLKNLDNNLKKQVFGQSEAIDTVVRAIKRSRAGFNEEDKPIASLLFVGPTGVGKTEVSKQLSIGLSIPLIRFDMSEYQEKHTVARLIGSPPGYVGYEEGGLLVEAMKKNPHCVLLLDEIEKAHPDILNVLLQVMDYATLTDNTGKKADFRNAILIMTSNAGAREASKNIIGFGERIGSGGAITKEVERVFSPEFRNRLDNIIVFNKIDDAMALQIAKKAMKQFEEKLLTKNIKLVVTENLYAWLSKKGFSEAYGAREINRVVQQEIKTYFVDEVLFGELSQGGSAVVDIVDGKLSIIKGNLKIII